MSHGDASRRNALRHITLCFSFRYYKQLIAQLDQLQNYVCFRLHAPKN